MSRKRVKDAPRRRGAVVIAGAVASALVACVAIVHATTDRPDRARPIKPTSGFSKARQLLEAGKINDAKAIYLAALKENPKDVTALRGMGMCCRDAGQDEEAVMYWEKLAVLEPNEAAHHRQLALTYRRMGRDLDAMSSAQTALALSPDGDVAMSELLATLMTAPKDRTDPLAGMRPTPGAASNDPFEKLRRARPPDPTEGLPGMSQRNRNTPY